MVMVYTDTRLWKVNYTLKSLLKKTNKGYETIR